MSDKGNSLVDESILKNATESETRICIGVLLLWRTLIISLNFEISTLSGEFFSSG